MNQTGKRSRSKDFEKSEISLLVELVLKYQNVLECKKTDAVTTKEKDEVWGLLARDFNAESGTVPRPAANLKTKYENLKKILRRKLADEKCEVMKTGGGAFTPCLDPILEKLRAILSVSVEGLNNPFDSTFSRPISSPNDQPRPIPRPRTTSRASEDTVDDSNRYWTFGQRNVGLHLAPATITSPEEKFGLQYEKDPYYDADEPSNVSMGLPDYNILTRREILGDNTKSWSESLKRPVSFELLTPRKRHLLDEGKTIEIDVEVGDLPVVNEGQPSTSFTNITAESPVTQFSQKKGRACNKLRGKRTLASPAGTPAVVTTRKFQTLADQKMQYVKLKEQEFKREVDFNRKKEELTIKSLQYDLKIKKARLQNIQLKNRLLKQHFHRYH